MQSSEIHLADEKDDKKDAESFVEPARILFNARKILLFGEINADSARKTVAQLHALSDEAATPIYLFISSPGGHVESGDAIHDAIRFVEAPVYVIGTGWVASAGALIYLAAKTERRYALPNTRFMLHQPLGGVGGSASDIEINAAQILKVRERINRLIADATGQSFDKVSDDTDRDYWMTAEEAKDYGIVAHIIQSTKELG